MENRSVRMAVALGTAALLTALSAMSLGLVDAGLELDGTLARLEHEAAALHQASTATVVYGAPPDAITRPRSALRRTVDDLSATAARTVRDTAPPYARWAAAPLSASIDLVPSADRIDRALVAYLDQSDSARAEPARTDAAIGLNGRLLDLSYGMLAQRISEARERTRQAVARALAGVQGVVLLSIAVAALAIGLRS